MNPIDEYPNLPQETANCDKFTLTAEEVEVAEIVFSRFLLDMPDLRKFIVEHNIEFTIINNLLTRIKQWQKEKC